MGSGAAAQIRVERERREAGVVARLMRAFLERRR